MRMRDYRLPDRMQLEFERLWKEEALKMTEIASGQARDLFVREYVNVDSPFSLLDYTMTEGKARGKKRRKKVFLNVAFSYNGEVMEAQGEGVGPLEALTNAMISSCGIDVRVLDYSLHGVKDGADSEVAAYLQLIDGQTGYMTYGAGQNGNTVMAIMLAYFSALNRLEKKQSQADKV